jgi:hypothetical protein
MKRIRIREQRGIGIMTDVSNVRTRPLEACIGISVRFDFILTTPYWTRV